MGNYNLAWTALDIRQFFTCGFDKKKDKVLKVFKIGSVRIQHMTPSDFLKYIYI